MSTKEMELLEIENELNQVNESIISLENKRKNNILTMKELNELSELHKRRKYLELLKCDKIYGTHKIKIQELNKSVMELSMTLFAAKTKYIRSDEFNLKHNKEELDRVQSNVDDIQKQIVELEKLDNEILGNTNKSL